MNSHEISEHFKRYHNIEISSEEIEELQLYLWEMTRSRTQLSSDPVIVADVGKTLGFVAGAVLGAFLLPGLGLAAGWLGGAVIGGAIGYRLVSLFDSPQNKSTNNAPDRRSTDPAYRFSGTGSLGLLGTPIPQIYGNREINPDGGIIKSESPLIWTKVYTERGGQWLDRLTLLAAGRLGSVNIPGLLLDDKPLTDFSSNDYVVETSSGYHTQPNLGQIVDYSQSVITNGNNLVGIGQGVAITAPTGTIAVATLTGAVNGVVSGSNYTKNAGGDAYNAGVSVGSFTLPGNYGSYIGLKGTGRLNGSTAIAWAIGFTAGSAHIGTREGYDVAAVFSNTRWEVWIGGTLTAFAETGTNGADQVLEIRFYRSFPVGYVQVFYSGAEVWHGLVPTLPDTVFGSANFFYQGTGADLQSGTREPAGSLGIGVGSRFFVNGDGNDLLIPGNQYYIDNLLVSVLTKTQFPNSEAGWVEFDREIWISDVTNTVVSSSIGNRFPLLEVGDILGKFQRAKISTTKAVNRIDISLEALHWARNADGNLVTHGTCFDLRLIDGSNTYILGRFIIYASSETTTSHTISILNLSKKKYAVDIAPVRGVDATVTVRRLTDRSTKTVLATTTTIDGNAISLEVEAGGLIGGTDVNTYIGFANKSQTSADNSPTIKLTHLNEVVIPVNTPTYGGYTIGRTKLLASSRLQSAPTEAWDIPKGKPIANYLHHSTLWAGAGGNQIGSIDVYPSLPVGTVIRILGIGNSIVTSAVSSGSNAATCASYSGTISTVSGSAVVTVSSGIYNSLLLWMPIASNTLPTGSVILEKRTNNQILIGDEWGRKLVASSTGSSAATFNPQLTKTPDTEIIAYTIDSSCYFPDIFVDRLIDPATGLGRQIDRDNFIDYQSIVYSRQFCVDNQFYYDGAIGDGSFEDWAVASAPSNLLFCTQVRGKYALIPQENSPADYLFNASNTSKYSESSVPWQQEITNTMLVKYLDNKGRERQVKIQTTAANNGTEPEYPQTIDTVGVTRQAQAIRVGQVALQSLKYQTRTCQIETDIAAGFYTSIGAIIRSQHTEIEYGNESSGFVLSVESFSGSSQVVLLSEPITAIGANTRITVLHRTTRETELDKPISSLGNNRYQISQLNSPIAVGDVYAIGESSEFTRVWRITAIAPDVKANKVTLTCIAWSPEILETTGLTTVLS